MYMLFASWEVRIVKNCDQGQHFHVRGQFFTIRTDPKPVNNLFFSKLSNEKNSRKKLMRTLL